MLCGRDRLRGRHSARRQLAEIEPESWERIYHAMHEVLKDAVAKGGYMELPLTNDDTVTGGYNEHCRVYDRGGETCLRAAARSCRRS